MRKLEYRMSIGFCRVVAFLSLAPTVVAAEASSPPQAIEESDAKGDKALPSEDLSRLSIDLDSSNRVSFLAQAGSLATKLNSLENIKTPGRGELAKVSVPAGRDQFDVKISAFRSGFASEAPSASEQLLMEDGYSILAARHGSLTSGDASGEKSAGGISQIARSFCETRQEDVICLFMQGEVAQKTAFERLSDALIGSYRFEGKSEGFATDQLAGVVVDLGAGRSIRLDYPAAYSIVDNDFGRGLPASLQLQRGEADNPLSVVIVSASNGAQPPDGETIDNVADALVDKWMVSNATLFTRPVLATKGDLVGLGAADIGRTYAYIVDKKASSGGKAQIRLSLFASHGIRYSVLMVTTYSPEVNRTDDFFVRLGAVSGYDLVMRSILRQIH